ncbi:MAG: hypothetical protein KBC16_02220 [Candidatus Pacebacteria bacterium]|nr:hypothetical protein [Candidatus Paceibacterota bacterium]
MFGRNRFRELLVIALSASAMSASVQTPPMFLSRADNGKRKQKLPPKKLQVRGHQYHPRPYGRRT